MEDQQEFQNKKELEQQDGHQASSSNSSSSMVHETEDEREASLCWKKPTESMFLVQRLIRKGISLRRILSLLYPMYSVPTDIPDAWILQLLRELCEQRTRTKLHKWNSFEDAVELFRRSKRIMVITGAGVSVSCGIPDFRSENGVYARLSKDFPELPDPHSMFDIDFFRHNPKPFYNFAREIFPGQFRPSVSHMFIKFLEEEGKLLRNFTQNIDTLERTAGIQNLVECHGSFARSTCLNCKNEVDSEEIRDDIAAQRVSYCKKCKLGVMKPNIVFFGEDLGESFHTQMGDDHKELDLLVVIGSSMQVRPVSLIPFNIDPKIPQILINREMLPSYQADIKLLGNCDIILAQLALAIGGEMRAKMVKELESRENSQFPSDLLENLAKNDEQAFITKKLQIDEFKRIIGAQKSETNIDEPEPKKQKLGDQDLSNEENNESPTTDVWMGNYVLVESRLPAPNYTLLVPPNLNVFMGAELFYDRDRDTFVHRPGVKQCYQDEDDGEELDYTGIQSADGSSSSSGQSSSDDEDQRAESLPPRQFDASGLEDQNRQKSQSCPPNLDDDANNEQK